MKPEIPPERGATVPMPALWAVSGHIRLLQPDLDIEELGRQGKLDGCIHQTRTPGRLQVVDVPALEARLDAMGHDTTRLGLMSAFPPPAPDIAGARILEVVRAAMPVLTPEERARRNGPHAGTTMLGGTPQVPKGPGRC